VMAGYDARKRLLKMMAAVISASEPLYDPCLAALTL
jgi:hypothetical protein